MSDRDKRLTCSFIGILIGYMIATITITAVNFARINSDSYDFDDIAQNWQTGAIMDVTVSSTCPAGYEEAFSYTWPGTESGCWCGDVYYALMAYYRIVCDHCNPPDVVDCGLCQGYCDLNQTLAGCTPINSFSPVVLDSWGQVNSSNVTLCVKRSQETWLQVAQQSGPNCTSTNSSLKQCGSSPENVFCTSEAECPINNVQIVNLTLPFQSAQLTNCTSQNNCTVLAQGSLSAKVLYYQRGDTFDALPTAQMRINEYSMCLDMSENDITPGRYDFGLLNEWSSNCYTEGAGMWNLTDSMTEAQLFSLNGLTNTIDYLEPYGYYQPGDNGNNYTYSLFSRSYIPWNIDCRGSMNSVVQNTSTLRTVRDLELALMIVTIVLGGIGLGITLPILLAVTRSSGDYGSSNVKTWSKAIYYLAQLPMFGLQIAVILKSRDSRAFFQNIITQDCSTQDVLQILTSIASDLNINDDLNVVNISFQAFVLVFGLFYFHCRQCGRAGDTMECFYQPEQQTNENKYSNEDVPPQYPVQYAPPQQFGNEQFNQLYAPNNDDFPVQNYGNNFQRND